MKASILSGTLDSIMKVVKHKSDYIVDQEDKQVFIDNMLGEFDTEIATVSSEGLFHRSMDMVLAVQNQFRINPLWPRWNCPIFGLESMYCNVAGCEYQVQLIKDDGVVGFTYNCVDEDAVWAWIEVLMGVK